MNWLSSVEFLHGSRPGRWWPYSIPTPPMAQSSLLAIDTISLTLSERGIELIIKRQDGPLDQHVIVNLEMNQQLVFCQPQNFFINTTAQGVPTEMTASQNETHIIPVKSELVVKEEPQEPQDDYLADLMQGDLTTKGAYSESAKLSNIVAADVPEADREVAPQRSVSAELGKSAAVHQCSKCPKTFNNKSHLRRHLWVHSEVKPYSCDYVGCAYQCCDTSSLLVHKRRHAGERPYRCDYEACCYSSSDSSSLRTHERIHATEKPYRCNAHNCSYTSTRSTQLTVHKRRHTSDLFRERSDP